MANFWSLVNSVIREADVLLVVADARFPYRSVNGEVISKINSEGKKYLVVFNKVDLITAAQQAAIEGKVKNSVFVSATKHVGSMVLLRSINAMLGGKPGTVGVLGYPNMGKSSIINAMRGRKSAPVSSVSGFTKGLQKIRVTKKVVLIDTPGVIPFSNKDVSLQVLIGARHSSKLKDPETPALELMQELKGRVEKHYGVPVDEDLEESLEAIATKENIIKKGGVPDTVRMAKKIIDDWGQGKIK